MMTRNEIELLFETAYSKADYEYLFEKAKTDTEFFFMIWDIASKKPDNQSWRYLWILDHATEKSNSNIFPILDSLYKMVLKTENESVIRQTMKLILRCPINEDYAGELLNRCVKWMNDQKAKISSQALGLEFFHQTCILYPEMAPELIANIDDILERGSPSAGYSLWLKKIRSKF